MCRRVLLSGLDPDWHARVWEHVPEGKILHLTSAPHLQHSSSDRTHEVVILVPGSLGRLRRDPGKGVEQVVIGDACQLPFAESTFDHVVAAFFLQTTPSDPIGAFAEVRRVIKVGGRLFLLEYGLSGIQPTRWLMQAINRVTQRFGGRVAYREPWELAFKAGFHIDDVEHLWSDVVTLATARRPY